MIVWKAFRYRIYPTTKQEQSLALQFGHSRFVWNWALALRKSTYQETGQGIDYYELKRQLTALKHQAEFSWLKEAHAQVLQAKIGDLEKAYKTFFEKRARYPRFKNKRESQSIRYPQGFKFRKNVTYIPKVGWINTKFHRPLEGRAKNITVSKTKSGHYFVSIQCELVGTEPPARSGEIGIDLGLKSFLVTSEGWKQDNPCHMQRAEERLKRLQKRVSRHTFGSAGREKARKLLAHQHEKVANQRMDFLHKLSTSLVKQYGLIGMENLNVQGMVKNRRLAKFISTTGWGTFRVMLEYKGKWYGARVHKIDRYFPSSKKCSSCGYMLCELPLSIREWKCPVCDTIHDRDINSAVNILNEARAGVARTKAGGESVRPGDHLAFLDESGSPCAFSSG